MADLYFELTDPESLRIGKETEERTLAALNVTALSPDKPFWLLGARKGSPTDDTHLKTDIWLETIFGDIPLQIKSSAMRAKRFTEMYGSLFPRVIVVVIFLTYNDADIIMAVSASLCRKDARFRRPAAESDLGLVWDPLLDKGPE